MSGKIYVPEGEARPESQIGATLEALYATIESRKDAGDESYTHRLLSGDVDTPLKKLTEEAVEVALAAKDVTAANRLASMALESEGADAEITSKRNQDADAEVDHLRYEAADVVYHLLVVLARYGVGIDEFAAELNNRMRDDERPEGAVRLHDEYVRRGK